MRERARARVRPVPSRTTRTGSSSLAGSNSKLSKIKSQKKLNSPPKSNTSHSSSPAPREFALGKDEPPEEEPGPAPTENEASKNKEVQSVLGNLRLFLEAEINPSGAEARSASRPHNNAKTISPKDDPEPSSLMPADSHEERAHA